MSSVPKDVASSVDRLDLWAARRDLWPRDTLLARDHASLPEPEAVIWPETDEQLERVLRAASEEGRPVVPWGAGSGVCGGARAQAGAWTIDLKRLQTLGDVDRESWTIEVGAGVNGQRLEDHLAEQGWAMGHSPSSIGCSTVGGWLAARGAGQFSSAYGVAEDIIVGVDGVSPGEGRFHAGLPGASSTGRALSPSEYDMLVGSEGTLGVLTRLRLRVRPLPELRVLRGWRFPDVPSAVDAMRRLMQEETWPFALRLYDPVDTWIGGKTRPKKVRKEGHRAWYKDLLSALESRHPEVVRHELALPLGLPRFINRVAGGLARGCLLIVGWEGRREVVRAMEQAARPILAEHGVDLGAGPGERWYASRHAVSYKLMPIVLRGGFVDTMEVAAPWSLIPEVWREVRRAVAPHAVVMAHFSHAYPEGGSIYFSFAGRGDVACYDAAWRAARDAVLACGAAVSHHHGIGVLKRESARRSVGPAIAAYRDLQQRMDPRGILNPGVLFDDASGEGDQAPPPVPRLRWEDGLVELQPGEVPARVSPEVRWPWDRLPAPPREARNPWECGWVGVEAGLEGQRVLLGRGPREAVGPDLRRDLWDRGDLPRCWVGVAQPGGRAMGRVRTEHPWALAREVLRAGFRPGAMGVDGQHLYLGFRGVAAGSLSQALERWLVEAGVGGWERVSWRLLPRYAGPSVPCEPTDGRAVAATEQHVWRPQDEEGS